MTGLYFGPYNDPGDALGKHHWDPGHAPDCHNPAIIIERAPDSWSVGIRVVLRYRPPVGGVPWPAPSNLVVALYAASCGLLTNVADVETIAGRMVRGENGIAPIKIWEFENALNPAPYSSVTDTAVASAPAVPWPVPPFTGGIIVVATLMTDTGPQQPSGPLTQDPCVAVWLG